MIHHKNLSYLFSRYMSHNRLLLTFTFTFTFTFAVAYFEKINPTFLKWRLSWLSYQNIVKSDRYIYIYMIHLHADSFHTYNIQNQEIEKEKKWRREVNLGFWKIEMFKIFLCFFFSPSFWLESTTTSIDILNELLSLSFEKEGKKVKLKKGEGKKKQHFKKQSCMTNPFFNR
jgi:hypothetical protein